MKELTTRQAEILEFIRRTIESSGMPPTRQEIQTLFEFASPNAAEAHLRALAKKGVIEILEGTARGIRLRRDLRQKHGIPLIGRVAAGAPILAEAHVQGHYQVDPSLFEPRAHYLLKVRGMSMRDAGIHDGDLLAVHKTREARSGQIIVARLGDEVTVKRLRRRGGTVELEAANPDFKNIVIDPREERFEIEGLAVGLVRNGRLS